MGVSQDAQATADLLFAFSAPNAPARLGWLTLNLSNPASSTWSFGPAPRLFSISNKVNLLPSTPDQQTSLANVTQSWTYHVYLHHDSEGIPFESILLTPTTDATPSSSSPLPIILVPHGGPHSCFTTAFVASYVFLAKKLGAAVLFVNYRGSTGYGQRSIHSLAGTIGTNDVQDMMTCLQHALSLPHPTQGHLPWFNAQQVAVCGGSHGGFLGAHLSAQYPEVFQAAALRNPVTDIAAMVGISDIPDWCYVESLGVEVVETSQREPNQGFDWGNPSPSLAHLTRMREVSPVHVPSVTTAGAYKTPTLVCLGMKDRRVPPSQGVAFYQLLRLYHGAHVPLSLMTFPDDVHAIDLPTTEAEHWMAIAQWIQTHLHL
jgi:acylaminoacyl-peptidase